MPDLLTHGCVGLLVEWGLAGRRPAPRAPLFVMGNLLPDVLARVPATVTGEIDVHLVRLPPVLLYGWDPLHQPLGMATAALGVAMLFRPAARRTVFLRVYLGMLLHLGLDLLQHHEGAGHLLLFPLWNRAFEVGLIGSEDSVLAAPWLALACLAVAAWRRGRGSSGGAGR